MLLFEPLFTQLKRLKIVIDLLVDGEIEDMEISFGLSIQRGRGGGGASDLSQLSGLVADWNVASLSSLANLDPVITWEDSTANNHDATAPGAGSRPTYIASAINSQPAVRFQTDDVLNANSLAAVFTGTDKPISIAVALKQEDIANTQRILNFGNNADTAANKHMFLDISAASPATHRFRKRDDAAAAISASFGNSTTNPTVLILVCNGTQANLYRQGSRVGNPVAQDVGDITLNLCSIGASSANATPDYASFFDGFLGRLAVWSRALTLSEIVQVNSTFASQFSITTATPAVEPFTVV